MKPTSEQILSAACDEIALVARNSEADHLGTLTRVGPLLEWALANELGEIEPDQVIGLRDAPAMETAAAHLETDEMTQYLQDRFNDPKAEATSVSQIVGGFSKRTTRVACHYLGETHSLVLRQAVGASSDPVLEAEYSVVRHAWSEGLNAPEPLWIEASENLLGGPFFVTRYVTGTNPGDVFGADEAVAGTVGEDLAAFLASLHRVNCGSLKQYPSSPMSTIEQILQEIENALQKLTDATGEPDTMVSDIFSWLRTNVPTPPEAPVLIHGDVGFHNLLVENEKVTVVLDWERAHPGDPAEDLAYLKPTLQGVLPWNEFLAHYESAGGIVPSPQALEFYTVWQDVWRYVACQVHLNAYLHTPRLSSLFAGRIFGPRFLADAVRNINAQQ
ncbi:MAG: hypothetical protein CMQ19_03030 [Gammaproteobacteria bacterium]|jgi:aminoglycoside phosphotransferase (APT) family kinase protein|nr:hypothetical protein [Gammaproteobacteria bacterium]|tara:strand:+ start:3515 stop:4678 length:1164 start_codon:yes stop_codon:yes gene_type:complete